MEMKSWNNLQTILMNEIASSPRELEAQFISR